MWCYLVFLLVGAMLSLTFSLSAHGEIIRRVNPDGTITEYVPQKEPSHGTPPPQTPVSPCAEQPWDPTNVYHARETYKAALEKLKTAPQDADCRQQALHFGRVFSAYTRRDRRVTIYDEAAIANDINAAAGGVVNALPTPR